MGNRRSSRLRDASQATSRLVNSSQPVNSTGTSQPVNSTGNSQPVNSSQSADLSQPVVASPSRDTTARIESLTPITSPSTVKGSPKNTSPALTSPLAIRTSPTSPSPPMKSQFVESQNITNSHHNNSADLAMGVGDSGTEQADENVFEVAYIVDHRDKDGEKEYYVHWEGYSVKDREWVSVKSMNRGSAGKSKATGKKRDQPSGCPPSPLTSTRIGPSAPKK
ncbi:MAG: hypothetical protein Q9215_006757 [Flavoplaca cf. flavocitrina]